MKIDKSMEQLNSVFREKMTMSIDDIAIHVYILSIWVQWYYRVCLHPVTAHVRVNMHGDCMTSCSVIVKRSMSKCLHLLLCLLTYCHSISVSDIYNKDTSSSSFWTSLSTAHKNSYCQSFISFLYSRAVVKTSLFTVKCHFVIYISIVTASYIPTYTVITWLSTVCCRRYFIVHSTHPWTNPYCLLRIKFLCYYFTVYCQILLLRP